MIIALDTNFIIYCIKQKIDFLGEIDRICNLKHILVAPEQDVAELKKLSLSSRIRDKEAALLALHIVEKYRKEGTLEIKKVKADDADTALLEFDKKGNAIATLDSALKQKIRNARIITIRQLKHLEFI
jgi:rRNA-processing protein FCF1